MNTIIILDFGSQYIQLIARRVREQDIYCEILPWDTPEEDILARDPKGLILSGGPDAVYQPGAPQVPPYVFKIDIPVLGICYGVQAMAPTLGGKVGLGPEREYGYAKVEVFKENPLMPQGTHLVWMSHQDHVETVPEGFYNFARSKGATIGAIANSQRKLYGVQFHP